MNLAEYQKFVANLTSEPSKDIDVLIDRLLYLNQTVNISSLLTGAIGMASESGEFSEIVKKCVFQGKPLDDATEFHLKRELGDICFYLALSCWSLNIDFQQVIDENVNKLEKRYENGVFTVKNSEVRAPGDL